MSSYRILLCVLLPYGVINDGDKSWPVCADCFKLVNDVHIILLNFVSLQKLIVNNFFILCCVLL